MVVIAEYEAGVSQLTSDAQSGERGTERKSTGFKVTTDKGVIGYVSGKYVRSPIDYRAFFQQVDGKWQLTAFVAGDLLKYLRKFKKPSFQESLSSDKRKYLVQQFQTFWISAQRYAELTKPDSLIHRDVAGAVNGLTDFLRLERKRVPGDVLRDAERLECILFSGYDPHFESDEPPGL